MSVVDLIAESVALDILGATVIDATDPRGVGAMELAVAGGEVFPMFQKAPAIRSPHPKGSPERRDCKGECGRHGHGLYDATSDIGQVAVWWGGQYRGANIGLRPPASMFFIDVDPRSGGLQTLARWAAEFEPLPETLTTISGRGDGGLHLGFQHPGGKLSGRRLKDTGVDLKDRSGYVTAPPSIHPATGRPYIRVDAPVVAPPAWLVSMLRPEVVKPQPQRSPATTPSGGFWAPSSIADEFSAKTSWSDILTPHGWRCHDHAPDADGAVWLHPRATSSCSATVLHGCLFIYSTNTPFDVTGAGDPNGYTKFRAYAVLNHNGDLSAAARVLRSR